MEAQLMIITASKKLPEEYKNDIHCLLISSFNLSAPPPFDYCFTALRNGEVIGFCAAAKRSISVIKMDHELFLLGLCTIDEKHRKRGYGSALLQYAVLHLRDNNCKGIILNCGKDRVPFYTANGFKLISEKARYSRNGHIEEDNDPVLLYLYSDEGMEDFYADSVFLGTDF